MRLKSSLLLGLVAIAACGAGFAVFELALPRSAATAEPGAPPQGLIGGPFALTDHTGKRVTDKDYRGRAMLVVFGYTYCPDICPASLANASDALGLLGTEADKVAPLFITVDPARDTQARLADYVTAFDRRLVGLTGTAAEVAAAAKAYRVYFARHERKNSPDYLMDHSAYLYVMDRTGRFVTHLRATDTPDKIADALRAAIAK